MYMRLSKEELAEMLIEANNVIDILCKEPTIDWNGLIREGFAIDATDKNIY